MTQTLTITQPDDMHLHLRDADTLTSVLPDSARQFGRALIMPNLLSPVDTVEKAKGYRDRILAAKEKLCPNTTFEPLMSLYLTDQTTVEEVYKAKESGFIVAFKLYPSHATTNSAFGVTDIKNRYHVFEAMAACGIVLSIHGEFVGEGVDIFDRERVFLKQVLSPLLVRIPNLKVVLEHVTTKEGVDFVKEAGNNIAATITAHHLLLNRNALFEGGLRPHHYCLPVLKREEDRQALLAAATSGSPKFFLGTDSAPHSKGAKESACGCAGIYTAFAAMSFYAQVFESVNCLDKLEGFASTFGAAFYGLRKNQHTITLVRSEWQVDETLSYNNTELLVPFCAGQTLTWQLQ